MMDVIFMDYSLMELDGMKKTDVLMKVYLKFCNIQYHISGYCQVRRRRIGKLIHL